MRHVLLHCPRLDRRDLLRTYGTERLEEILNTPGRAQCAAKWLIYRGVMDQFRLAAEIEGEEVLDYEPFPDANDWA